MFENFHLRKSKNYFIQITKNKYITKVFEMLSFMEEISVGRDGRGLKTLAFNGNLYNIILQLDLEFCTFSPVSP